MVLTCVASQCGQLLCLHSCAKWKPHSDGCTLFAVKQLSTSGDRICRFAFPRRATTMKFNFGRLRSCRRRQRLPGEGATMQSGEQSGLRLGATPSTRRRIPQIGCYNHCLPVCRASFVKFIIGERHSHYRLATLTGSPSSENHDECHLFLLPIMTQLRAIIGGDLPRLRSAAALLFPLPRFGISFRKHALFALTGGTHWDGDLRLQCWRRPL